MEHFNFFDFLQNLVYNSAYSMTLECEVEGLTGDVCRMMDEGCFFEEDINRTDPGQVGSLITSPYEGKCPNYEKCMELRAEKMQGLNSSSK